MARKRRRLSPGDRRRVLRDVTVEASIARASGIGVRQQVAGARNAAMWGASILAIATAVLAPGAVADAIGAGGLLEALAAIPFLITARRAWRLHQAVKALDDPADPELTEGDNEIARLAELVALLRSDSAKRVGRSAIEAAQQGYEERRRIIERRVHIDGLLADADTELKDPAVTSELEGCSQDLRALDAELQALITSVARLADVSEHGQDSAIRQVRDATSAVNALAAAMSELERIDQPHLRPLEG